MEKNEPKTAAKKGPVSASQMSKATPATIDLLWQHILWKEFHLKRMWDYKWHELLLPENLPQSHICTWKDQFDLKKQLLKVWRPRPSPPLPEKTSEVIGWRAKDPATSFELYKSRIPKPPKIRFVREAYGYYRNQPKLPDRKVLERPVQKVPTRRIMHTVKPLLC